MKKAIQLEAGFQLSEGVNMARRINVMQAEVNAPGYQKLVVDEVDIESNAETLEEVHTIWDDQSCQQDDPEDSECLSEGEEEQ